MDIGTLQESELTQWFDHLAHVFETTGRDYFVRHWHNDPNASVSDIFVAREPTNKTIVSTVKVYRREFYFQEQVHKVGGIGEVSTKPEYRAQGLAQKLLDQSIPLMIRTGITISALSASKARKYYEKLGWQVVPFDVSLQKINIEKLLSRTHETKETIAAADFSTEQATQLIPLHHFYAQHFNGPLHRGDIKYWTEWVKSESNGNAWVVLRPDGRVDGLVCLGVMNADTIVVKDFCVGEERWARDQGRETLQQVLEHFVRQKQHEFGAGRELVIRYPSAIVGDGKLYTDENIEIEKKESFLYRLFGGSVPSDTFVQNMANNFVFWDVDKF